MNSRPDRFYRSILALAALASVGWATALGAQTPPARPVALVLCNWKYRHLAPLLTPEADAAAMRRTLESLSPAYEVTVVSNATSEEMRKAISSFTALHKGNPVVLVYTSGHGLQVGGTNYLAGVDANLDEFERQANALREVFRDDAQFRAQVEAVKGNFAREHLVSVDDLVTRLGAMSPPEAGDAHVKMVFIDACREAFPDLEADSLAVTKSLFGGKGAGGLARVTERPGIFVGMSAAANQVSQQNDRDRLVVKASLQPEVSALGPVPFLWRHYGRGGKAADIVEGPLPPSLFTERLVAEIVRGGSLEQVFNRTGSAVRQDTETLLKAGRVGVVQTPAKYSLYYGNYVFGKSLATGTEDPSLAAMREALAKAERERAAAEARLTAENGEQITHGSSAVMKTGPATAVGNGLTSEEVAVRGFFQALGEGDEPGVTQRLAPTVNYYDSGRISRTKVLEDIRGDWHRYSGAVYRIQEFHMVADEQCQFVLEYELNEGSRKRLGRLSISAVVVDGAISELVSKVISAR